MGSLSSRNLFQISFFSFSLIFIFLLTCLNGCKESVTDPPPEEKPPGYQEDIPWPSLADSPWPMYSADPQQTNRSKYKNYLTGIITQTQNNYNIETSLSISSSASILFTTTDKKIYNVDSSGHQVWESVINTNAEGGEFAPVILKDGSILAADISHLYKFDKNGLVQWEYAHNFIKVPSINIGKDGTIFVIGDFTTFLAISLEGDLLWQLNDLNETWSGRCAISPDGTTIYLRGNTLSAIDIAEHKVKWKTQFRTSSPLVDSKGNIFCLQALGLDSLKLLALDKNGNILWSYPFKDQATSLTIDKVGNIYFGDDNVYSVDYTGKLNWKLLHVNSNLPIICDNSNNIYVIRSAADGFSVKCISDNGSVLWENNSTQINYTPAFGGALGYNRLYLPGWGFSPVFIIQ